MRPRSTRPVSIARRATALALCYLIALQVILTAFATTLAVASGGAADGQALAIACHGADGAQERARGGGPPDAPALACLHCAIACVTGVLLCVPTADVAAPQAVATVIGLPDAIPVYLVAQVRAGLARAPPAGV